LYTVHCYYVIQCVTSTASIDFLHAVGQRFCLQTHQSLHGELWPWRPKGEFISYPQFLSQQFMTMSSQLPPPVWMMTHVYRV